MRADHVAQVGVGDRDVADEVHTPHFDLGVLGDVEPDVDGGRGVALHLSFLKSSSSSFFASVSN